MRIAQGVRFSCLGIDVSSRAIDLVTLDENANQAEHDRLQLDGDTAFDRCRKVADVMPQPGWYEERGVYLVGVEIPESRFVVSLRALLPIVGAVLATLPDELRVTCWNVSPAQWKGGLGIVGNAKPEWFNFPRDLPLIGSWSQDALDALGVALYVREKNRAGIERRIA